MLSAERVVVLAPHTDDGEFGCGATMAKFIDKKVQVHYVAFSICEASVPAGFPKDILATEVREATQFLGIPSDCLLVHRYPVRYFPRHRQDILEKLVRLNREIKPDLVFIPSSDDIHQDHQVVSQEGIRAFKHASLLGYEMAWNNFSFIASAFVHLEKQHVDKKIAALKKYKSQQHRIYADEGFIKSLARVRGAQASVEYAEAFEVIRWVIQ